MKKGQTIGKYAVVVELGKRAPPIFAAHASVIGAAPELVVIECVATAEAPAEANDAFVKRARRLAQVRHPNICRIRDVVVTKEKIAIASDFIEGESLAELLDLDVTSTPKRFGLPEQLRVLVDVLSGMSSIHLAPELAGGKKNDPPPFHGAIHPRNIVVGADGSTRLVRIVRPPVASSDASQSIEEASYAAPEFLLGDVTAGARVDVYAVGVLLWEALAGTRLFSERDPKDVVARQLSGALPRATPPAEMEWANALVDIAARALDVDPDKRFASTAELAGALRLAVQARLAPASRVGAAVTALANGKITERRARLLPAPRAATAKIIPAKAAPSIANPAKIAELKRNLGLPSLATEEDNTDHGPETKRLRFESLDEEDLELGDDDATDAKWGSVPPAKKTSIAPPLKKPSIAPPLNKVSVPPPLPTPQPTSNPIANAPIAAPSSNENIETIAPVVAPFVETPAISAAAMQQSDASGAVIFPLEDPQRRKRVAIVIALVGFAALILLVAGIRRATSSDDVVTTAASARNSGASAPRDPAPSATTPPPLATTPTATTPVATTPIATTNAIAAATPNDNPVPTTAPNPPSTPTRSHDGWTHTATPSKATHKKPPRSSYEPEGI